MLPSYSQLQELRPYYSFTSVSVDRYLVNNVYTQTMLAPRELRVSGLPAQAQTWVNQHITYTHGYGVTVSAVNQSGLGRVARLSRPGRAGGVVGAGSCHHPAAHLLRAHRHQLRARQDQGPGVRLPRPRRRRLHHLHRQRRHPGRFASQPARPRGALRRHQVLHLVGDHGRQPRHPQQQHQGASVRGRAVPHLRQQPLHGDRRRQALLDRRRLHHDRPLPVLAAGRRHQLHPQLGEGRDRRLQRHDELLRLRPHRPAHPHLREDLSRHVQARGRHAREPAASTCATPRTSSRPRPRCSPPTT